MNALKRAEKMAQSRMIVSMAEYAPAQRPGTMDSDGDGDGDPWKPVLSKPAAHYRDAIPGTVNRCNNCMHFTFGTGTIETPGSTDKNPVQSAQGTCDMVEGDVASDGLCSQHSPMPAHDSSDVDIRDSDTGGRY